MKKNGKPAAAYSSDLAYIHDVGFGDFARGAARGLLALLRRAGICDGLVVDLGCGSGIWARELLRTGYQVLGVDISPATTSLARKNAPSARFVTASFLNVKLPTSVAVTALGECFNYAFDQSNGLRALQKLFRKVHHALVPGGMFVFDVAVPQNAPANRRAFVEGEGWAVLAETRQDGATLVRTITSFRKTGKLYRRTQEVHRLRLYKANVLTKALRHQGFEVKIARSYGRYKVRPDMVVVIARKRR
jgi:SAM-dependent methyltransferase